MTLVSPPLTVMPGWQAPASVRAVTSTRAGGFSKAPYAECNLALHVNDAPMAVRRNRAMLSQRLQLPAEPAWLNQSHSTSITRLRRRRSSAVIDADGAVAFDPATVCVVMTADCLPLFLCNKAGTKVAAIHVGWRGLADGIVESAVAAMEERSDQIMAWAGPCISVDHFEIGQQVKDRLGGPDEAYRPTAGADKYFADLNRLTGHRLQMAGVTDYGHADHCTYRESGHFFSYRRDGQTGRMASLIWIDSEFRL